MTESTQPFRTNPYVAGNAVGRSKTFVGRTDVLEEVIRYLQRPEYSGVVLYGQRRIGKTSILQYLQKHLPEKASTVPAFFDLQDKASWSLGRVLHALASTLTRLPAFASVVTAEGLVLAKQQTPESERDFPTEFEQKWLPRLLNCLPAQSVLTLLLDEFDVLADKQSEKAVKALFPYLTSLMQRFSGRLFFVFVVGRNVGDLDSHALSVFKGLPRFRVSTLDLESTTKLIKLSEDNQTLLWQRDAVEHIWNLTHGHPYLTQQLCSSIWDKRHDGDSAEPVLIASNDVIASTPDALSAAGNALDWLWDGLPPAERVVAAALAEAGPIAISTDELHRQLHDAGVRVIIRELENAPLILQEWDLIEPVGQYFAFRVELLRQWIERHHPLTRVQEELDRIEPVAENLFRAGASLYQTGQLEQAAQLLSQSVQLNPNHVGGTQLLAQIQLARGEVKTARQLLERLYESHPSASRGRLVQVLLLQAEGCQDEDETLGHLERILAIEPFNTEAHGRIHAIWHDRGQKALTAGDLEAALHCFERADEPGQVMALKAELERRAVQTALKALDVLKERERLPERVEALEALGRRETLTSELQADLGEQWSQCVELLETEEAFDDALALVARAQVSLPDARDWQALRARLQAAQQTEGLYRKALGTLAAGQMHDAVPMFLEVLERQAPYKEAAHHLHHILTGIDVKALEAQTIAQAAKLTQVQKELERSQKVTTTLQARLATASQEQALLKNRMEADAAVAAKDISRLLQQLSDVREENTTLHARLVSLETDQDDDESSKGASPPTATTGTALNSEPSIADSHGGASEPTSGDSNAGRQTPDRLPLVVAIAGVLVVVWLGLNVYWWQLGRSESAATIPMEREASSPVEAAAPTPLVATAALTPTVSPPRPSGAAPSPTPMAAAATSSPVPEAPTPGASTVPNPPFLPWKALEVPGDWQKLAGGHASVAVFLTADGAEEGRLTAAQGKPWLTFAPGESGRDEVQVSAGLKNGLKQCLAMLPDETTARPELLLPFACQLKTPKGAGGAWPYGFKGWARCESLWGKADCAAPSAAALAARKAIQPIRIFLAGSGEKGFMMGTDTGDYDEKPSHSVTIQSFHLSKTEVTVAQYRACVKAGKCTAPDTGDYCNWNKPDRDSHPVNCVDWEQARAYAAFVGGGLPSEAQWEYAARGMAGRTYPWGNTPEPSCKCAVIQNGLGAGCGRDRTWAVCSKESGNTPTGLCDMGGNVWEWVEDCYENNYTNAPSDGSYRTVCSDSYRVLRGGSWYSDASYLRGAVRGRDGPSNRGDLVGFRVVWPASRGAAP